MIIQELIGKTFTEVKNLDNDELIFSNDKESYKFYHQQSCCESVHIDDICGDLKDLENTPILQAEENSSDENPEGIVIKNPPDSFTWTFYRFSTIKGSVVVKWYGESNGYYSEDVDFTKIK